ncbi:MAG: hypothetical protein JST19_10750 [Bacteroidetes bacterium]|nr:hypothetical protein [Bacteroidota bacterium]
MPVDPRVENFKKIIDFIDRIEVSKTLDQFGKRLTEDFAGMDTRSKLFIEAFDANFPVYSFERVSALTSLRNNIYDVIMLYLLNQKSAAIIELHSELETLSILYLTTLRCKDVPDKKSEIKNQLRKKSLPYFTEEWVKLKVWDDEDAQFCKRLTEIRNGVAHKNLDRVKQVFGIEEFRGQMLSKYFTEEEIIPLIMNCLKLEIKLTLTQGGMSVPLQETYRRAKDAGLL